MTTARSWALGAAAAAAALLAAGALATDAPHDASQKAGSPAQPIGCMSCHTPHNALGTQGLTTLGNVNLCASCHTTANFGFPYNTADQATPGGGGLHHHWDSAAGSGYAASDSDAQTPSNAAVLRLINQNGGNLNCSACHDQHKGASAYGPANVAGGVPHATQHRSAVVKTPPASAGTVTVNTLDPRASPRGYLLKMGTATTWVLSNDGGTSYFCYVASAWTTTGCTGNPVTGPGAPLNTLTSLNDPAGAAYVQVTVGGTPALSDTFGFYVSYPFPRMDNDKSAMCENCHVARVMNAAAVDLGADGTKRFSHPVGDSLVAGRSYDRTGGTAPHAGILDANGSAQTTGDGNVTNDLDLASDGTVRCMTCHYPHATDSNSLSVHAR